MKKGHRCSRLPVLALFVAALTARFFFFFRERENLFGAQGSNVVVPDEPWGIRLNLSEKSLRVVVWTETTGGLNGSGTTTTTTSRVSSKARRIVEPLGVQNWRNDSQYESLRYYWNDPTWSQEDSYEFYPTCNSVHELDLSDLAQDTFEFLYSDGAFRLSALYHPIQSHLGQAHLRMIHYDRPFSRADMIMAMTDATAMQRLQASPWVVSIYQACGLSMLSELMTGGTLTSRLAVRSFGKKNVKYFPMDRLRYAVQATHAVADVHASKVANMDLQSKNFMMDHEEQVHLNDFNLARIQEMRSSFANKTQADNFHQDLIMLGKVLYPIRTGRRLRKDMNDGFWKDSMMMIGANDKQQNLTEEHWVVRVQQLNFSSLEEGKTTHRATLALTTLEWAISACLQTDTPRGFPSAQQLLWGLEGAYEEIRNHAANRSLSDIQQIFERGLRKTST